MLRSAGTPVDAQQVAQALAIHVSTARFHLGALESQGMIRRRGNAGGRVGRPRLTYQLTPRLDYSDIVALFATHLGGTPDERELRATRVGADLAHRVRLTEFADTSSITDLVVSALTALGFGIRSVMNGFGEISVQICTCPLAEIAVRSPEVVRGIQQGLIQEIIDCNADAIGKHYSARVRPDPRQGSCEVTLVVSPASKRVQGDGPRLRL